MIPIEVLLYELQALMPAKWQLFVEPRGGTYVGVVRSGDTELVVVVCTSISVLVTDYYGSISSFSLVDQNNSLEDIVRVISFNAYWAIQDTQGGMSRYNLGSLGRP